MTEIHLLLCMPEAVTGRFGCEVRDINPFDHFDLNILHRLDRSSQLAMVAARQAVTSAALDIERLDPKRVGVSLGTTLGGMVNATRYYKRWAHTGHTYASLLYDYPLYSAGARIIGEYGFSGPNLAFSTACSSANIAIGHAADLIR